MFSLSNTFDFDKQANFRQRIVKKEKRDMTIRYIVTFFWFFILMFHFLGFTSVYIWLIDDATTTFFN